VVCLKAAPDNDLRCPFVSEKGCRVYADRPASCRTYPLARAVTRSRETGVVTEHFALMREDHCCGCHEARTQTVNEWLEDQGVALYNRYNDMLMDIISMKNRHHPRPLGIREQRLFHLALYDLDGFRQHLGESAEHEAPGNARADTMSDEELLVFGYAWLKRALFGKDRPA
jgi:Fe-S-cluster containining protein